MSIVNCINPMDVQCFSTGTCHPGHYCLRLGIEKLQVPARHATDILIYLCNVFLLSIYWLDKFM